MLFCFKGSVFVLADFRKEKIPVPHMLVIGNWVVMFICTTLASNMSLLNSRLFIKKALEFVWSTNSRRDVCVPSFFSCKIIIVGL